MIKVNAKYILAALPHVSTGDNRYYLEGLFFEPCKDGVAVVATDGHTMFAALDTEGQCDESAIMPISKELIAGCKQGRNEPDRILTFEDGTWKAGFMDNSHDGGDQVFVPQALGLYQPIDGTYPDWRRVLPSGDTEQSGGFNPALFVKFQKSAKALDCDQITVTPHGEGPALISFLGHARILGCLMPMRGEQMADVTAWTREVAPIAIAAE